MGNLYSRLMMTSLACDLATRIHHAESAPKETVEVRASEPFADPAITWSIPSFREPKPYGKKSRRALRGGCHD